MSPQSEGIPLERLKQLEQRMVHDATHDAESPDEDFSYQPECDKCELRAIIESLARPAGAAGGEERLDDYGFTEGFEAGKVAGTGEVRRLALEEAAQHCESRAGLPQTGAHKILLKVAEELRAIAAPTSADTGKESGK